MSKHRFRARMGNPPWRGVSPLVECIDAMIIAGWAEECISRMFGIPRELLQMDEKGSYAAARREQPARKVGTP